MSEVADDKKTTRAAVVLFVEVDQDVPVHHAAVMVSQKLAGKGLLTEPFTVTRAGHEWNIQIHEVMEAGMAAGNGYLGTKVTNKAYPRKEEDD